MAQAVQCRRRGGHGQEFHAEQLLFRRFAPPRDGFHRRSPPRSDQTATAADRHLLHQRSINESVPVRSRTDTVWLDHLHFPRICSAKERLGDTIWWPLPSKEVATMAYPVTTNTANFVDFLERRPSMIYPAKWTTLWVPLTLLSNGPFASNETAAFTNPFPEENLLINISILKRWKFPVSLLPLVHNLRACQVP